MNDLPDSRNILSPNQAAWGKHLLSMKWDLWKCHLDTGAGAASDPPSGHPAGRRGVRIQDQGWPVGGVQPGSRAKKSQEVNDVPMVRAFGLLKVSCNDLNIAKQLETSNLEEFLKLSQLLYLQVTIRPWNRISAAVVSSQHRTRHTEFSEELCFLICPGKNT